MLGDGRGLGAIKRETSAGARDSDACETAMRVVTNRDLTPGFGYAKAADRDRSAEWLSRYLVEEPPVQKDSSSCFGSMSSSSAGISAKSAYFE